MVQMWRSWGYKAVIYIDDGIIGQSSEAEAEKVSRQVKWDLEQASLNLSLDRLSHSPPAASPGHNQNSKWQNLGIRSESCSGSCHA